MANPLIGIFRVKELRERILFTAGMLVIFRVGAVLPIPGINVRELSARYSNGAPGLFNLFLRRCGHRRYTKVQFLGEIPIAKDLDRGSPLYQTLLDQAGKVHGFRSLIALLNFPQVDDLNFLPEGIIGKAPVSQAAVQGHLPPFKPDIGFAAGTGLLSLVTFPRGGSPSGTLSPADNPLAFIGALGGM
ncbi:hypothetical protein AGMMS50268_35950 [Spirochaetia bacterium]|nr:hypothetical protein AGMMS50268_35950 [Spirochaetia bacterium]